MYWIAKVCLSRLKDCKPHNEVQLSMLMLAECKRYTRLVQCCGEQKQTSILYCWVSPLSLNSLYRGFPTNSSSSRAVKPPNRSTSLHAAILLLDSKKTLNAPSFSVPVCISSVSVCMPSLPAQAFCAWLLRCETDKPGRFRLHHRYRC